MRERQRKEKDTSGGHKRITRGKDKSERDTQDQDTKERHERDKRDTRET